jgi:hypothetical protein
MYVTRVPNRSSPPAVLLRESWRDGGKVKTRTLANLTHWPEAKVEALRRVLRGETLLVSADRFDIERALPHGHVAAVLGTLRTLGLDHRIKSGSLLPQRPERLAKLALALIAARVVDPAAKLATARQLSEATASHSLGAVLRLGEVDEDELYRALDLLGAAQPAIEGALARRHLEDGTLVLYDVTSSYLEGRCRELARFGYSRDGRPNRPQIVFGLLCTADGCPVAVEAFEGDVGDPKTLATQIDKLKKRFGLKRVVLVGDHGMITSARIEGDLKPAGLDWITALRAPAIQALTADGGPLQLSLFDEKDMAEISSPDFPGERLIVCRNPALAEEQRRKREDLLAASEKELAEIRVAVVRPHNPLRGAAAIGLRAGSVLARRKVAKHFTLTITEDSFAFARDEAAIAREKDLDGFYVLRTSLPAEELDAGATVFAYKGLVHAERAFRSLNSIDLDIRPVHHRLTGRVRAHVFLCMLAYYVARHMQRKLAPLLFEDHDRPSSAVAAARVSPAARAKAHRCRTEDGEPLHSFRTLLADLATLTRNTVRFDDALPMTVLSRPTPLQQRAFDLLGIALAP